MKHCLILIVIALLVLPSTAQNRRRQKVQESKLSTPSNECMEDSSHIHKHGPYHYVFSKIQTVDGAYDQDMRVGPWSFKSGDLAWSGEFQADSMIGRWVYRQSNTIIAVLNFNDGNTYSADTGYHKPTGSQPGQIRSIVERFPDGLTLTRIFYKDGQMQELDSTDNIRKVRVIRYYSKNSILSSHVVLRDGFLWSVFPCERDESAETFFDGTLMNGNGAAKVYAMNHESGQLDLSYVCTMKDGKLNGQFMKSVNTMKYEGNFENGYLSGTWTLKSSHRNDSHTFSALDKLTEDTTYLKIDDFRFQENHTLAEIMPSFPGGEDNLREFLVNTLYYPQMAREQGIMGKVYVQFKVDKTGMHYGHEILKSVHPCLDNESLRVIKMMPVWNPGFVDGLPRNIGFTMPINFVLTSN